MNNNAKFVFKLSFVFTAIFIGFIYSNTVFACDPCNGGGPGSTWCNGSTVMECTSCSATACTLYNGAGPNRCTLSASSNCDGTCPLNADGQWSRDTGVPCSTCTAVNISPVVNNPPLSSPVNGFGIVATTNPLSTTLSWNAPTGGWGTKCPTNAQIYRVFAGTTNPPLTQYGGDLSTATTSVTYTAPTEATYYWRVQAINNNTATSETRSFTTCRRPVGYLDGTSCNWVSGWAGDPSNPNLQVQVQFYNGLTYLGAVTANQPREAAVCTSIGGVNCGECTGTNAGSTNQCLHGYGFNPVTTFGAPAFGTPFTLIARVTNQAGPTCSTTDLTPYQATSDDMPACKYTVSGTLHQWGGTCSAVVANTIVSNASSDVSMSLGGTPSGNSPDLTITGNPPPYSIANVIHNGVAQNYTFCANDLAPPSGTSYILRCLNTTAVTPAGNCANVSLTMNANQTVLFKYSVDSTAEWYTGIDGDIYASSGASATIPTAPIGNFGGYLIEYVNRGGFAFSSSGISTNGDNSRIYESIGGFLESVAMSGMWPTSYTSFAVPSGSPTATLTVGALASLNPNTIYTVTDTSLNVILVSNDPATYTVTGNGIAVVYVSGTGTINFSDTFQSNNTGRIMFVTNRPVQVNAIVVNNDPIDASTTRAAIEAGIITTSTISFPSGGTAQDASVIVEGPLIANGDIIFSRDRGSSICGSGSCNLYPAQVVRYNPVYLRTLTSQERASSAPNVTGLFVSNISWDLD